MLIGDLDRGTTALAELPETGPPEVAAASRALAATAGGQVVASGGTTGKIKVTTIAHHQGIPRLVRSWRPLHPGDVLLNLFRAGRLWGAHYFYNALAAHCSASVLPMGLVGADEVPDWLDTFVETGVGALAGPPSVLADFAAAVSNAGARLAVRTVIWVGEPMTPARHRTILEAFPQARLWGNYGSIETYVIAVNDPACDPDVLHLLPGQVLEVDSERSLLTRDGEGWPVPAQRYRLGDRLGPAGCRCERGEAFRVLGRADDRVKFYNTLLCLGDVLAAVRAAPGVADAQLVLTADRRDPASVAALQVRYVGPDGAAGAVRTHLLRRVYALAAIAAQAPGSVRVERVDRLQRNDRTGKVTEIGLTDIRMTGGIR